jgi:hypothetical protein
MRGLIIVVLGVVTALTGCASQIMKSYVGKDVREIMVDYGPPANAFDMGDGRRVFQWTKHNSIATPMTATTTWTWVNSNTLITGGQTLNVDCIYTMFATWDDARKGWIVAGYKTPKLDCQ